MIMMVVLIACPDVLFAAGKTDTPERVPEVIVSLDSGKDNDYAVVVEKSTQKVFLFASQGRTYRKVFHMNCSTGEASGPKTRSGDKKTPEGVYFFVKEHEKRYLSPTYGSRAYPIDYPNLLDQVADRGGNAIWLHGTNKPLKARDSNGCIVMENKDIDKLSKYITLHRTPIIIVEKISYTSPHAIAKTKKDILRLLGKWNDANENGTYHHYLQYYDPDYVPDISWWADWNKIRKELQKTSVPFSLSIQNISIFNHKKMYTVLFDQSVESQGRSTDSGVRKLYLRNDGNEYRITGEEYQLFPEKNKENPLVAALSKVVGKPKKSSAGIAKKKTVPVRQPVKKTVSSKSEITAMIDGWLKAWSAKDIKHYGSYYAKDFRSQGGASLKNWLKYKDKLNRKYKFIKVSRKKLAIKAGKTRSSVSFVQIYASDQYRGVGLKQLVLKKEGKEWKIYRESWKRM
jgi:murein L,D-transpeptidase YafK